MLSDFIKVPKENLESYLNYKNMQFLYVLFIRVCIAINKHFMLLNLKLWNVNEIMNPKLKS
jgi:hypothetical protein